MAEACRIILLPTVPIMRLDLDLAAQQLTPAANRRNIVELRRIRLDRELAAQVRALKAER